MIQQCKQTFWPGQDGTWITPEAGAYTRLQELGYTHSAELWQENKLVGGLQGIRLGKVFFGESMFSKVDNAAHYAFTCYVKQLPQEGAELIDGLVYTAYLESMGANLISTK